MKQTKKQKLKRCNEPKQQDGANQRKKARQHMESKQLKVIKQLLKENQRLQNKLLDVQSSLSKLRDNSQSLTDLIHLSWEGIRTKSVDYDEVKNAVNSLYLLSDNITKHTKHIIKKTAT